MGKQYISTAVIGGAHLSDVYGVAVTKPYTVTVSGDGFLKLWANSVTSGLKFSTNAISELVDKSGLHHVTCFEDVYDTQRLTVVAVTSFAGQVYFYRVQDGSLQKLELLLQNKRNKNMNWAIEFVHDPENISHSFVATQADGNTDVYVFKVDSETLDMSIEYQGTIKPKVSVFAMCTAICPVNRLVATGFANGDVMVSEIESCRTIFTFRKPTVANQSTAVSSSVRALKFSPSGTILATAYDSGNFGNILLYDTKYGESIGSLTTSTHSSSARISVNAHEAWIFGLDFNAEGDLLVSGGFDAKLRVWNMETREREATINLSVTDYAESANSSADDDAESESAGIFDVKFIAKGIRNDPGSLTNDGIVCVGCDKGIRWFREAGGV